MDHIVRKAVAQLPVGFPKDDIPQARLKLAKGRIRPSPTPSWSCSRP
ncbi:hypothetical protein [Streptomyces yerevanensis]|nr:hypothetical protein [Streptomyces yerevanensis]